jgi:predicted nucleic acid-binding protein
VSRFILDSTVTLAWCFSDEATGHTESFLNRLSSVTDTAVVPALWLYEVVNVVTLAARKRRITQLHATQFLQSLSDLPIEVDYPSTTLLFKAAPLLAERHRLTGYDAAYLELAIRLGLPMATLDQELIQASNATGVIVL